MVVSEVDVTPVKPSNGLVAFASCVIDGQLYLGSIGVHTRLDGTGFRLTYPTRKVGAHHLNYFHPLTKEAARQIEEAIFAKCAALFGVNNES